MTDAPEGPPKPPVPPEPPAPKPAAAPASPGPAAAKPAAPAKPRVDPVEEALRRVVPSPALDTLKETFPADVLDVVYYAGQVTVVVPRDRIVEILAFLHDDPRTAFDLL